MFPEQAAKWQESNDPDEMMTLLMSNPVEVDTKGIAFVLAYAARRLEHVISPPSIGIGFIDGERKRPYLEVGGEAYHFGRGVVAFLSWCRIVLMGCADKHLAQVFPDETSLQHLASRHAMHTWAEADFNASIAHLLRRELGNPFVTVAETSTEPPPQTPPETVN